MIALKDVTMKLKKGEIMCLLGDNGAGKSTLIKTLAGVHKPDEGEIIVEGNKTIFDSPKEALDMGIATVYQDLALVSLIFSISAISPTSVTIPVNIFNPF